MSNTLVCLTDHISFHAQDIKKTEILYINPNIKSIPLSSVTDKMQDYDMREDENKLPENAVKDTLQKPNASRKREASNTLKECVKRRDFQRECEIFSHVPFEQSKQETPFRIADSYNYSTVIENKAESESDHSVEVSLLDVLDSSSVTDSGIETLSKSSSPCHSTDTLSSQDDDVEECPSINMDIDNFDPILSMPQGDFSLGCQNPSQSPVAIYEDLNCLHLTDETVTHKDSTTKSPISKSLFSNVASSIYFSMKDENVAPMPDYVLPFMKWKLSTITPVLIKDIVQRCGFSLLDANTTEEWLGTWGKHLKCGSFKRIKNYQKVNHYPGSFHLGRKDKLWDNYKRMQARFGTEEYNFFPETFYLPNDLNLLKKAWEATAEDERCWIIKPPASARGTGVKVIYKWSQVPKNRPVIVQRYLSDPYLINGTKFDLRIYVLVTSIEPLRVYVYKDGLVRFASEKYSLSSKSFSNRFVHLTNYSVNRKSASYTVSEDGQGHKWTLKTFWAYMANSGIDVEKIQESITDMIIKTVVCAEGPMCRLMKTYARSTYNCFELFGFDIMLDKNLRPWLLEVNISPSLHTRSILDFKVKGEMVKDMLNMAAFQVPEKKSTYTRTNPAPYGVLSTVANRHKALRNRGLATVEKEKHSVYTFKYEKCDILSHLTPDDVRCLIESEDEFDRKGGFERIFPTTTSSHYFRYFEHIRYYNLLLDAWEKTYATGRKEGIEHLQELCDKKIHLQAFAKEPSSHLLDDEPDIEITVH